MLFTHDDLRRIATGEITVAFRRWRRPTVKTGGMLRTGAGVLAIESVDVIDAEQVTDADARRAGRRDRAAALAGLRDDGRLYRIGFRLAGPDPRIALRERSISRRRSARSSAGGSDALTPRVAMGRGRLRCCG